MKHDFYALLGLPRNASEEAIQGAVHQALLVTTDSAQRLLLRHARDTLCDPLRRATHDRSLKVDIANAASAAGHGRSSATTAPRNASALTQPASPWAWRMGLVALVLVVGGISYQLGKPKRLPQGAVTTTAVTDKPSVNTTATGIATPGTAAPAPLQPDAGTGALSPETIYASVSPSVVVIESLNPLGQPMSRGSGVVVGSELVVTNCHVVLQASAVRVRSGTQEYNTVDDTSDTQLDLCLLRVPNLVAAPVARGTVKQVRVGQTVFAIGSPHGLERTLSQGLVSALRETVDGTLIQTSASISPGSSGGGLFDNQGRLIGITTFQHKQGQNLNFALPVDFLDTLRTR